MRNIFFFGVLISASTCLLSCGNPASDPDNKSSEIGYNSLSEAGDTVTQHASDFSTAMHHVTNDLNQIPVTGNVDMDFALMIKSHIQGAVDLAQAELKSGENNSLKSIAREIADSEKPKISALEKHVDSLKKGPLQVSYDKNDKNSGFTKIVLAHRAMMWDMSKMDTSMAADNQFVAVIIPQLQSAVYLSEGYLKYGKDPWLTQRAAEIVSEKKKELIQLKGWMETSPASQ